MHDHQEGKLDLVPMIDCIMLLLLFFILTSSFAQMESVIASILPTEGGSGRRISAAPTRNIAIVAIPDGLGCGKDAEDWQRRWIRLQEQTKQLPEDALVRVGGAEPFRVSGAALNAGDGREMKDQREGLYEYIRRELVAREQTETIRLDQAPINVHCFSGLPWKVAIVVYDAVRAYEKERAPEAVINTPEALAQARIINFGAPPVRNFATCEAGWELLSLSILR